MSVFIEELLIPLREQYMDDVEAVKTLNDLLLHLEKRPLRSVERMVISTQEGEFIKLHNISPDSQIAKQVLMRIAFEYMPCVSRLGIQSRVSEKGTISQTRNSSKPTTSSECGVDQQEDASIASKDRDFDSGSPVTVPISMSFEIPKTHSYFLCTVQRHKSALWTSYRLFVDGISDMSGNLTGVMKRNPPDLMFGARKLKSAMSNQYLIWPTEETKYWKEKNAVAKFQRFPNSTYVGRSLTVDSHIGSKSKHRQINPYQSCGPNGCAQR